MPLPPLVLRGGVVLFVFGVSNLLRRAGESRRGEGLQVGVEVVELVAPYCFKNERQDREDCRQETQSNDRSQSSAIRYEEERVQRIL
jgi:hypothetical protein